MREGPDIAGVAALLGDPARASILGALMAGQALTAGELATTAGVMPQTASGHLAQLREAGLVAVEQQGRHRYYRLAGADVAAAIEALMDLAAQAGRRRTRPGPRDPQLRAARVCYDHLAGAKGVDLFARLCRNGLVALDGGAIDITAAGAVRFERFGVDVAGLRRARRPLCRTCLDWSERRPHLAGALGAALLSRLYALGWARRIDQTRVIAFSPRGEAEFARLFG